MSVMIRSLKNNLILTKLPSSSYSLASQSTDSNETKTAGEFRILQLMPKPSETKSRKFLNLSIPPSRTDEMSTDQDWVSVWPGLHSFHPAIVPLPIRQGFPKKNAPPPNKYGNVELMKIPNFLHLTPPAIKRHCEALKQFCTTWPECLKTEEKCNEHFPIEYIYSDYCYSSPTIRESMSRIITIKVKLSQFNLDTHASDKILRLLGPRYDFKTDIITIVADRCPTKKQNREYAEYLLTALYHEAWRIEPWENEKKLVDMEYYDWDKNMSRKNLVSLYAWPGVPSEDYSYGSISNATKYKIAVTNLMNNGEDQFTVNQYYKAVKKILHLTKENNSQTVT